MAWKVGELARRTGLTVRTLHHYERIGLLEPAERTRSGHRLYDEAGAARLYQVVALRELGLSLDAVRTALDGELGMGTVLHEHLTQVERQLGTLRLLHRRLSAVLSADAAARTPADFLDLIEKVTTMEETVQKHFSEEQLAKLAARREALGDEAISSAEQEWPQLIANVQAEMDAGTDPADPRVQALARRWAELVEAFHGGDPELRESLNQMYAEQAEQAEHAEDSERPRQEACGPAPQLLEYVGRAWAAAG
ncbi:MerR family transcriptional regulator [Streptomyces johnsoniae]|uniref:MerR family transcriptional regulator n=1 Tax=Streptomyces johnsoniae TaxID=3075532 RepID=A0ABU2RZJ8_9ACTN|nr:MerR family transcriptional regulator [Streptomyces sp. DSM 41886]MDT0441619.1 MerR family transcriptional regulator [Streptomyces sp. DSM 41886]